MSNAGTAFILASAGPVLLMTSGLATITPAAGFVGSTSAIIIGLLGGAFCYTALSTKTKFKLGDSHNVVGIRDVGGLLGTLCVGVLASTAVNPGGADGLFAGNLGQLFIQLEGAHIVSVYAFVVSWVIFKGDACNHLYAFDG